jgi:hypothetical protein
MAKQIDFDELLRTYGVPADEFNTELSTIHELDEAEARALARSDRMGFDRTASRFDRTCLAPPAGTAVVEFGWLYESFHMAREAARFEAQDMASQFENFVAIEPDYAGSAMRYYFSLPPAA